MIRRAAFLFCSAALFLLAADAEAGARVTTPMDRFVDAVCEASPEAVALDPIQKALRDLAVALAASKLPSATLTFEGGEIQPMSLYCRATCVDNCKYRCNRTYMLCQPRGAACEDAWQTCHSHCIDDCCFDA